MTPKKKYIIIGAVGAIGWVLAFAVSFALYGLLNPSEERVQNIIISLSETPSEESLKKLEAAGITREDVRQVTETWKSQEIIGDEILNHLRTCDNLIQNGNATPGEFVSCSVLIGSFVKHLGLAVKENSGPIAIINRQGQTNMTGSASQIPEGGIPGARVNITMLENRTIGIRPLEEPAVNMTPFT